MQDGVFEALEASMKEAVAISKGEMEPSKVTAVEIPDVKAIREALGLTQEEFGKGISASKDSVKSWEQGRRNPTGLSAKILKLIDRHPELYPLIASL